MMDSFEAQKVISRHRNNAIVVTTMTAQREWPQVSTNPDLDMPLNGAMGKASSVGLGLALAQPNRKVIVLDGDGSLLMNLGSLVTIANMAPPNLIHFVFENGLYRTTGGQPIPNIGKFSFTRLIREAGYANTHEFEELEDLENNMGTILNQVGPTSVCLKVPPITERPPFPLIRTPDVILQFMASVECNS
ncbi:thiamine pyrophosphate-dependent enzyme [Chloroflexota bacterium]